MALYQVDISILLCSSMSNSWQLIPWKVIFTLNLNPTSPDTIWLEILQDSIDSDTESMFEFLDTVSKDEESSEEQTEENVEEENEV